MVSGRMIRPVEEVVKPAEGASQHSVQFDMKIFSPFELQKHESNGNESKVHKKFTQNCIQTSKEFQMQSLRSRLTDEAHLAGAVARICTRTVIPNCHVDNDCVFLQCVATEK